MAEPQPTPPDELFPMNPAWDPNLPTKNSFAARWPDGSIANGGQPAAQPAPDPGALGLPATGLPPGLAKDVADLKRQQLGEQTQTEGVATQALNADLQRIHKAYDATGIGPNDLQPFEQDKMRQKYSHSPIEAFGSLGSVFAMVASAFTRQPMTNSLNAGAAALNAIHKGDEEEFKQSFDTWKANNDLVVKRHAMMRESYSDAIQLMNTDMAGAQAKFRMQAARFGDQQSLLLLDKYGMSKELLDLQASRDKAVVQSNEAAQSLFANQGLGIKIAAANADPKSKSQDPQERQQWFEHYFGNVGTVQQQAIKSLNNKTWTEEGRAPTPEEYTKLQQGLMRQPGSLTPEQEAMAQHMASDPESKFNGNLDAARLEVVRQYGQAKGRPGAAGATTLTPERDRQQKVVQFRERYQQEHPDASAEDVDTKGEEYRKTLKEAGDKAKSFTKAEMAMVETAPSLMKHLRTLDRLADQTTGLTTGELQKLAAEYGGINDPAAIYEAARKGARDSLAAWSGGGQTNKATVEARLDRLPKTYQNARFNRRVTQDLMQDVISQTQSGISLMEKGGKKLDDLSRKQLTDAGIFGDRDKAQDPLVEFKKDPQNASPEVLKQLSGWLTSLPLEDQKAITAEIDRREAEWNKAHGK